MGVASTTAPTPSAPPASAPAGAAPVGAVRAGRVGACVWVGVVVVGVGWGTLWVAGPEAALRAAPLMGHWSPQLGLGLVPAAGIGLAVVAYGPRLAARARGAAVPALTGLAAATWTAALAAAGGWSQLTEPLTTRHEYEPFAAGIGGLGPFLASYVDRLPAFPIHVQGHPPGPVVLAWALDRVGLGGAGWLAAVAVASWGVAAGAALVAARAVAGERAARRAAPALAVLPAAVWAGTSVDPVFAALVAVGVAALACAGRRRSARGAAASGAVLGVALLCSYGAAPLLLVAAGALAATTAGAGPRTRARLAAATVGAALAVMLAAGAGGFWWPDGLAATRAAYWSGVAADRPGLYLTLAGNPAALALAVGPATFAGLAAAGAATIPGCLAGGAVRRVPRSLAGLRAWVLPAAAVAAVAAADLSQLSRGEVERIWLPFFPWLALAAPGDRRRWLAAQVAVALVLQAALDSPW